MKRLVLPLLALPFLVTDVSGQCSEPEVRRILTVGDSWSVFMNASSTFNNTLRRWGHSDKRYFTNLIISENGAKTHDFLGSEKQDEIAAQLAANPSIDVVHLSIGGNDVLGTWHISWPQEDVDSLEAAVTVRLTAIMDFIKSVRPGIRIVWSGYAYPNFGEVIGSLPQGAQSTHPFYSTWNGMGKPDFLPINNILNTFSAKVEDYAADEPQVDFVNCTGILQHVFGQTTPLAVEPGGTYQPFEAPMPAGFPEYPSPRTTMSNYGFFTDAFHLSAAGYDAFIDYQFRKFYHKHLMDDQYILATDGPSTGGVSEAGTVTSAPMVGESDGKYHAAVLSFATTAMPDTGVSKASVFLRREGQIGGNVYSTPLNVRITRGHFGPDVELTAEDFAAPGEAEGTPCVFGSNGGNGHWVRLDLPEDMLPYINNESDIQIHITAPDASGRIVTYSDASDPDYAPVLNMTYGPKMATSVQELAGAAARVRMYPNPTTGLLTVETDNATLLSAEAVDLMGRQLGAMPVNGRQVDLSSLTPGMYVLRLFTTEGVAVQRVMRK